MRANSSVFSILDKEIGRIFFTKWIKNVEIFKRTGRCLLMA